MTKVTDEPFSLMVIARLTADCQDAHFLPKTDAFSTENEKKQKTTKYIFVQK